MLSFLEINKLVIPIFIGVEEEERTKTQDIEINIKITFHKIPKACFSTKIEETICYDDLVKKIKEFCFEKHSLLIEELTYKLHQYLKETLSLEKLALQICKQPPITEIKGNCCFTIED